MGPGGLGFAEPPPAPPDGAGAAVCGAAVGVGSGTTATGASTTSPDGGATTRTTGVRLRLGRAVRCGRAFARFAFAAFALAAFAFGSDELELARPAQPRRARAEPRRALRRAHGAPLDRGLRGGDRCRLTDIVTSDDAAEGLAPGDDPRHQHDGGAERYPGSEVDEPAA